MFSNSCIELHVICCGVWLILYHYSLVSHDVRHFLIRLLVFFRNVYLTLYRPSCMELPMMFLLIALLKFLYTRMYWAYNVDATNCCPLLTFTCMQTDFSLTMQYLKLSRKSDYFWKLVTATQYVSLCASKHVSTETFLNWHNCVYQNVYFSVYANIIT